MSLRTPTVENGPLWNRFQLSAPPSRKNSLTFSIPSALQPTDFLSTDPDELFTQHTVADVKVKRQRLREEADGKKEELRLMVGERYRDLLQASTSIISISHSSKRVLDAFEEMKDVILSQGQAPAPRRVSLMGKNDAHLQTLQLLSAHVKLLLDTPEHLWRLIESKQYYTAAWLFLLARVVHRALISDDEDEQMWNKQGLNVTQQFPLVQRQWDAVSQFRSQIIHKATLSFREHETSSEDNCATLLTLHLLDARPLSDALSVFLTQRSKALHTVLGWRSSRTNNKNSKHNPSFPLQPNGHLLDTSGEPQVIFGRTAVADVKKATLAALGVIFRTLGTARDIFQHRPTKSHSMMNSALEYIQSDSSSSIPSKSLPPQVVLDTEGLLSTLPSSTHFLFLPPNLRSYRPYVDPSSSASSVSQAQLDQRLEEWFRKSVEGLRHAAKTWFADLQGAKEVWHVRTSILNTIDTSSVIDHAEISSLKSCFDHACLERLLDIWKERLRKAGQKFRDQLASVTGAIANDDNIPPKDMNPIEYLFEAPPLPTFPQSSAPFVSVDVSVRRYKSALQQRLTGRTSLASNVLDVLENCGKALRKDLSLLSSDDDESSRALVRKFKESCSSDVKTLYTNIMKSLRSVVDGHPEETRNAIRSLVFVSRIANDLPSSSVFASCVDCEHDVMDDFSRNAEELCDNLVGRWREYTVSKIVRDHWHTTRPVSGGIPNAHEESSSPSPHLVYSFLSLSTAIQQLGVYKESSKQQRLVERTLRHLITEVIKGDATLTQLDIAVLQQIACLWGSRWPDVLELLDKKRTIICQGAVNVELYNDNASGFLARMQVMFATLLPDSIANSDEMPPDTIEKMTALLPLGVPAIEKAFQPAFRIAKPSSRFSLVLIGNETPQY